MADPVPDSGKTWGIPNALWNAVMIGVMTAVLGYFQTQTRDAVDKKGEEAAVAAEQARSKAAEAATAVRQVKTTLSAANKSQDTKLDNIATTTDASHMLLNGNMETQLKLNAVAMRRIAQLTNNPVDAEAAELAEKALADHLATKAEQK